MTSAYSPSVSGTARCSRKSAVPTYAGSVPHLTSKAMMQSTFQPLLDRIDSDAQLTARHQQAVAGVALEHAWLASIGSLLLGIGAPTARGWRLSRPAWSRGSSTSARASIST